MASVLTLSLSLAKPRWVSGESCFFEVSLQNSGDQPARIGWPLAHEEAPLLLRLAPADQTAAMIETAGGVMVEDPRTVRYAKPTSGRDRQGAYEHGSGTDGQSLLPADSISKRAGDLLEWFGTLQPGDYVLSASYAAGLPDLATSRIPFSILPSHPISIAAPRHGSRHFSTPESAVVVDRAIGGMLLCTQGAALPKVPIRALLIPAAAPAAPLFPATASNGYSELQHVVWAGTEGWQLSTISAIPSIPPAPPASALLALPSDARCLESPLATSSGRVIIPVITQEGARLTLFSADAKVGISQHIEDHVSVALGTHLPVGPHALCWDQESALHFLWATPGGRSVYLSSQNLLDSAASTPARELFSLHAPINWIEATIQSKDALGTTSMFVEFSPPAALSGTSTAPAQPPLALRVWAAAIADGHLFISDYSTLTQQTRLIARIEAKAPGLRIVASIVRKDEHLGLLLADAGDAIYYAATSTNSITPLADLGGQPIKLQSSPTLFCGRSMAPLPWIYLQWVDLATKSRHWSKLEPLMEAEPKDLSDVPVA